MLKKMCLKISFKSVNRLRALKTFEQTVPEFWGIINKGCLSLSFSPNFRNNQEAWIEYVRGLAGTYVLTMSAI